MLRRSRSILVVAVLLGLAQPAAAQQDDVQDVVRVAVLMGGQEFMSFTTAVDVSSEAMTLPNSAKKPADRLGTAVLSRPARSSLDAWTWHEQIITGQIRPADLELIMYTRDGKPIARYHMEHGWPAKIEVGALKAGASEVLMETVTIICESLHRVQP